MSQKNEAAKYKSVVLRSEVYAMLLMLAERDHSNISGRLTRMIVDEWRFVFDGQEEPK